MNLQRTLAVAVRDGLHARPASHLVQLAKSFRATIEIEHGGVVANARSSVKLLLLAVKEGDEVVVRASGEDAAHALDRVTAFLASDGESASANDPSMGAGVPAVPAPASPRAPVAAGASPLVAAADAPPLPAGALRGIAASAGLALGPAHAYFPPLLPAPASRRPDPSGRMVTEPAPLEASLRLDAALAELQQALQARRAALPADAPAQTILRALAELAADPDWTGDMHQRIRDGDDAYAAAMHSGAALAARFEALANPYLRARGEDLRGLSRELGARLLGLPPASLHPVPPGAVIVADELTALDLADVDLTQVAGLVCRRGAAASHGAIVARAYGVPAVFGVDVDVARLQSVRGIALDGATGAVVLDPDDVVAHDWSRRIAARRDAQRELQRFRDALPRTRAGREVVIAANLGSLREVAPAREAGAMGVGLFRTELLFMQQRGLPSEEEQAAIYRELALAFHPHPVIVRTLDVGGDKPLGGLELPREDNPFLGWRGVRLCLDCPELFRPQLRALLRAAEAGNLKVMVPMVSEPEEVQRVRALIDDCSRELRAEGLPCGRFGLGIMIETPAAVLQARELARHVDFFSIGTNDLTQYVMAADRANAKVARLYRAGHPAVMRAIELTCEAAAQAGIWVGICGEAAADPALIPRWIELGVRELSMSPAAILAAKRRVCEL